MTGKYTYLPEPARKLIRTASFAVVLLFCLVSCGENRLPEAEIESFSNPISVRHDNTSMTLHGGKYYFLQNRDGNLYLSVMDDPTKLGETEGVLIFDAERNYGLMHMWHPLIINRDGVWYIYFTADDGNTDNHQFYVAANPAADPLEGRFEMLGRISTDPDNNWAIHAHVFQYDGQWYMVWSGWESRRVYVETQCIYIARMADPMTLETRRVKLSEPEYEWERQWVDPDGTKQPYPIFVNESPFFFDNELTDKLYLFYCASGQWTVFSCVGMLTAEKGSDILDPDSWTKSPEPVFKQSPGKGVYGPGLMHIIPSPDSTEYYMVYKARTEEMNLPGVDHYGIWMQKLDFSADGRPEPGIPAAVGELLPKPSGIQPA
ncbi:MAG: glycoside hydrolase family 43 protein [Alistipes sp.]|nr:glycoside hydrolase family 43 protein [Alistipes sp.]